MFTRKDKPFQFALKTAKGLGLSIIDKNINFRFYFYFENIDY